MPYSAFRLGASTIRNAMGCSCTTQVDNIGRVDYGAYGERLVDSSISCWPARLSHLLHLLWLGKQPHCSRSSPIARTNAGEWASFIFFKKIPLLKKLSYTPIVSRG